MSRASARAVRWPARFLDGWAGLWRWVLLAGGTVLAAYFILERAGGNAVASAALLGGVVIGVVLTFSTPLAIALLATPALFIVQRVGFGGGDLSVSDAALAGAFGAAVLFGKYPYSRPLKILLVFNLVYQFGTLFTVIVNPQVQNTVEWFHAWLLISGALIVGWALGRGGYARTALLIMVWAGAIIAVGTLITAVFQYAAGNIGPVYPRWPLSMHKNAAGTLMAFAAMIVYVNPPWLRVRRPVAVPVLTLIVVAILLTQSRQALIGLIFGVIVVALRARAIGRSRWPLLLAIPGVWVVVATVIEQIESQNQHNSFFQRLDWLREVYAFWKHSPIFGHGLRFWYYEPAVPYQPPQAEVEVAASAGVVGLAAFIAMWIGILVVLWRIDPKYGTLALAVVGGRIAQAQFDLFWVAAQVSIPFVIAGICLGAMALRDADAAAEAEAGGKKAPPDEERVTVGTVTYDGGHPTRGAPGADSATTPRGGSHGSD